MSKVTDGSYGSLGTPVGADSYVAVQASGPAVKIGTHADLRDYTNMVQATGTDADTTMAVNTLYVVDMSAWATADRTYTLPATAAVGDRCGVMVTAGDASHELKLTAGTGDTLNGIAGGTEWSRLFISNEVVIMRCVVANATWIVEHDGRIAQKALLSLTTSATGETASTFARPTNQSGAWTARTDNASITTAGSGEIKTRRAGSFELSFFGTSTNVIASTEFFSTAIYLNGTSNILCASTFASPGPAGVGQQAGAHVGSYPMAVDDYIVYQYRSSQGSKGLSSSASPRVGAWFSLTEIL